MIDLKSKITLKWKNSKVMQVEYNACLKSIIMMQAMQVMQNVISLANQIACYNQNEIIYWCSI